MKIRKRKSEVGSRKPEAGCRLHDTEPTGHRTPNTEHGTRPGQKRTEIRRLADEDRREGGSNDSLPLAARTRGRFATSGPVQAAQEKILKCRLRLSTYRLGDDGSRLSLKPVIPIGQIEVVN